MMNNDLLQHIQRLQFSDKPQAERLLLDFLRAAFDLSVAGVELRPLAVSLNSFNGFLTLTDGRRLFFKTHVESDTMIDEYYNARQLEDAGYSISQPLYESGEVGKQVLIYAVIDDPSVFDVAWMLERGERHDLAALTAAQNAADDALWGIYQRTLAWQQSADAAKAPIHQLFYHRLTGGRLARFYADDITVDLPDGSTQTMGAIKRVQWVINGREYGASLETTIQNAIRYLDPTLPGASVIGHGDAHNGNLFYRADGLMYFDPAFAGRHSALLDLVKPLFHNVFAMWMYFPNEIREKLAIRLERAGDVWHVEHDYTLHPVRRMFFDSKVERVLKPCIRELKTRGWLHEDWRAIFKLALFCCPFLTMNLADAAKFSPEIRLLGLSMAVEMGVRADDPDSRSLIDTTLDFAP
ncbi:MAG: phosphotransferase [Chloroflexota bacterium]|nr:phosphotransferase [Chloroflexota bacterium]